MNQFEAVKKDFSLNNRRRDFKLQLVMPNLNSSSARIPGYDKNYNEVILSVADVRKCFDPVIEKIIGLVEEQVTTVNKAHEPAVQTVILIGGLGTSPYLRERLQSWCTHRGIRMTTPWSGA
jgi:hypothetical protein